ncbi:hypothetical protein P3339_09180 [Microbulbifer sp. MLAF003]|uniref:hypothetical protein n=1 Tax=Microbulbifer sp. MLAF003 TaxID=3032582 RepID=UPI0024ADCD2F|nr:hypothetical protein [Microbulbifer sp. MLAF003]WHI52913.1 hypothetical protein P3339_09180 [Microbulbifer sp. MLAF003]
MKDKEIYAEIGQLLFNEAPDVSGEVHVLFGGFVDTFLISAWTGRFRKGKGFTFSPGTPLKLAGLVKDLKAFYLENEMGDWNVMHYVLIPSSSKYDLEFDYCKELENDEMDFSDYARRLDRASRIHQKCHWKLSAPSKIFICYPLACPYYS